MSFRSRYSAALSLIAAFALVSYLGTLSLISQQASYAEIINLSGKQRMLVTKAYFYADRYIRQGTSVDKAAFQATLAEFGQIENTLLQHGHACLSEPKQRFLTCASAILEMRSEKTPADLESSWKKLLREIDDHVLQIQHESEAFARFIEKVQSALLLIQLLLLLTIGLYLFWPAEKEIESKTASLLQINENLDARLQEELHSHRHKDTLLLQQSKMAIMGEMLSMIAHQWRQPLATISAVTARIQVKNELSGLQREEVEEACHTINEVAKYLSGTINDFRDFFRPKHARETVALGDIIKRTLLMLDGVFDQQNVQLETRLHDAPQVKTYANELLQVLLNITKNALDAFAANPRENALLLIALESSGSELLIVVEDNAGGIPEAVRPHIFEPYFTTKEEINGTGLGLYMSKTIVETHLHGRLDFVCSEDKTRFTLALPLENGDTSA